MNAKMIVLVIGVVAGLASCCKEKGEGKEEAASSRRKKSITTEARTQLKLMSNNARSYYATPQRSGSANSLAVSVVRKQFPQSTATNPPLGDCCKGVGEKCSPGDGSLWDAPTWAALDFAMLDPHYYSYEFAVSDDGASYTVLAYGDLDCDGEYSTFSLHGEVVDGEVRVVGDVQSVNPLE